MSKTYRHIGFLRDKIFSDMWRNAELHLPGLPRAYNIDEAISASDYRQYFKYPAPP